MKSHRGFSLIELMIVVTIVAILSTIAIPQYQNYAKRAKVSEALAAMGQCRTEVTTYMMYHVTLPTLPNRFGCEANSTTSYVSKIQTGIDGSIGITLQSIDDAVNGKVVSLVPLDKSGGTYTKGGSQVFRWVCGSTTKGLVKTNMPPEFLPSSCRG